MATLRRKASSELQRDTKHHRPLAHTTPDSGDVAELIPAEGRPASTLVGVLNLFPVSEQFWSTLPLKSAIALSQTCHQMRDAFQRRWNVDQRLSRFVENPTGLRSQLGKHGSLISGSFALQLFAQTFWPESDLDIFVEKGTAAVDFDNYLQQEEKYCLQSSGDMAGYTITPMVEVHMPQLKSCLLANAVKCRTYKRPKSLDRTQAKIQLIVTKHMPIQAILANFYTTAVVNIVTWNKAYSLFPKETLLEKKTFMLKLMDDYFETLLRKYVRRGWDLEEIVRREDYTPSSSIQPVRRLGDRFTWTVRLPMESLEQSKHPDFVLEHSTFALEKRQDLFGRDGYFLRAEPFEHIALEHRFVVAPNPQPLDLASNYPKWTRFLADRLHKRAEYGLLAIEPDERPEWYTLPQTPEYGEVEKFFIDLLLNDFALIRDFKRPPSWRTCDEDVPKWYQQWASGWKSADCLFPSPDD
ncbi:hypothetical protein H2202_003709 [Exophiala xenobiotica]|nr:hypothetical protein H2202_003709 [Exophiala xenobiotica]KAK5316471.1 hypothetical protein LTR93_009272 [Exophiala xenobiotica]KAK5412300.1 hypothetical protein LTR06_005270 [Exophiala xenobiotica]